MELTDRSVDLMANGAGSGCDSREDELSRSIIT